MAQVLDVLGPTFKETTWTGWIILLAGIFGGFLIGRIAQATLRAVGERLDRKGRESYGKILINASRPAALAVFSIGVAIGIQGPVSTEKVSALALRLVSLLHIIAFAWFAYNLVDVVGMALANLTAKTSSKLDDQLVPLVRKTLRCFVLVVFTLFAAQNVFNADISAWLAGLGIAGLAISLASQDSVKNLFGSVTVIFDQPFAVGDTIPFTGLEGTVEDIGFRSTKLRTASGHLVTVPNMKFIDGIVENISARPSIRRTLVVSLPASTKPEQVERALAVIRTAVEDRTWSPAFDFARAPPRVFLSELRDDGLKIEIRYWYELGDGRDESAHLLLVEAFNLKVLRALADAGVALRAV